ncbi:MAG: VanW family protein, partial [Firmicutes bacterium]|nr:VanW family protein [Bacillota bacterium]
NTKAINNGLIRENGEFIYVEGQAGVSVNVDDSAALLKTYIEEEWDLAAANVALSTEVANPRGTKEELAKVKDLLSSYSTDFKSSVAGRVKNVEVATGRIDGTVLYPGEEFSVNETILQREAVNGYEIAASYLSGTTVQSYGGGVCQVSTTLYNAVILAELEISERSSHSMTVAYVPIAMDAAIAGDYMDLKFVNNTEAPIYIEGYTKNKNLYFNIYGEETRPANRKVSFETEILSVEDPGTQFQATGDPIGTVSKVQSKHYGYRSKLWKVVTVDGVESSRTQFNKSNYRSSPRIVKIGTGSDNPYATAEVQAAIATGDEATIYAAISKYAAFVPAAGDAGPVLPASATVENPADSSGV